ncbi:MAG: TonB-dependent receptor plug domain-containing protein, partial [Aquabacterium sp.]
LAASAPRTAASAPQRVEITSGRDVDTEARRRSTAAKIVIGREEIERFGDSSIGEVLKRLPGVTLGGPPGRGGGIRMRGMGGGYVQILIDGERVPPGFSMDSLAPEQIERIEILRAPTAETGARAIAGTINIITREGFTRRANDLRAGVQIEKGRVTPGFIWTRADKLGERLNGTFTLVAFDENKGNASDARTRVDNLSQGTSVSDQTERFEWVEHRKRLHASARLQWTPSETTNAIVTPMLMHNAGGTRRSGALRVLGGPAAEYDHFGSRNSSDFTMLRLNGNLRHRLGNGTRLELMGGTGSWVNNSHTLREERDAQDSLLHTFDDKARLRDVSANVTLKATRTLDNGHSLVLGTEVEAVRRREARTTLRDDVLLAAEFGENLQADNTRLAMYGQDEWQLNPNWAVHLGLRGETIRTRGTGEGGTTSRNTASVLSPLAHAVWRPDPRSRDQLRLSLTRSYKSPTIQQLIARPGISARYDVSQVNTPVSPDRAGNNALKPELAAGLDLAVERYLPGAGVLSANIFMRRLIDYIRNDTRLETVSWSPVQRWVSRPHNIGQALTKGVELEAKFRLSDAIDGAPPIEVRANGSFYRSRVASVPGPDNRLDAQPDGTVNLGGDWRIRGTPATIGASVGITPAYSTRVSDDQSSNTGRRRVADAFVLWTFSPAFAIRVMGGNLAPLTSESGLAVVDDVTQPGELIRSRTDSVTQTRSSLQVRLEMKL